MRRIPVRYLIGTAQHASRNLRLFLSGARVSSIAALWGLQSSATPKQEDDQGDDQNDTEDADSAAGSVLRVTVVTTAATEQENQQNN